MSFMTQKSGCQGSNQKKKKQLLYHPLVLFFLLFIFQKNLLRICVLLHLSQKEIFTLIYFHTFTWELLQSSLALFLLAAECFRWMICTCIWWKGKTLSHLFSNCRFSIWFQGLKPKTLKSLSCLSSLSAWPVSMRMVKTRWVATGLTSVHCVFSQPHHLLIHHHTPQWMVKLQHQPDFFSI